MEHTNNLYAGLRRIAKDPLANPNEAVIEYAREAGYIYPNEYSFLMSARFSRNLRPRERAWKQKINHRILNKIVVQRRASPRKLNSDWPIHRVD